MSSDARENANTALLNRVPSQEWGRAYGKEPSFCIDSQPLNRRASWQDVLDFFRKTLEDTD